MTYGAGPFGSTPFGSSGDPGTPTEYLLDNADGTSVVASDVYYPLLSQAVAAVLMIGADAGALSSVSIGGAVLTTYGQLFNALLAEAEASDELRVLFDAVLADSSDASDALESVLTLREALLAAAFALDPLLSSRAAIAAVVAEAVALDLLRIGFDAEALAADATADGTLATRLHAMATLIVDAEAADALTDSLLAVAYLDSTGDGQDALDVAGSFAAFLESGGEAIVRLRIAGEDYSAWVLNLDTIGVTQYQNYGFNSFVSFNNKYYGAREDGLYLLEGDDDAGEAIDAWLTTGLSNFGTGSVKRMPAFYVGYTSDNGMILKVVVTDKGEKTEHWYRLDARTANATRADRASPGKGLASVYWQWKLQNIDGGDFNIDTMRFWPMVLTRRVR